MVRVVILLVVGLLSAAALPSFPHVFQRNEARPYGDYLNSQPNVIPMLELLPNQNTMWPVDYMLNPWKRDYTTTTTTRPSHDYIGTAVPNHNRQRRMMGTTEAEDYQLF
ncbi:uncharacterized protein LOC135107673 [Scylla paramamosain]|uniref:uncharacterized protein LOC135107673 n=1 Tax=Scylla paramamosain TaxID=85552 RepID=UPI0030830AC6